MKHEQIANHAISTNDRVTNDERTPRAVGWTTETKTATQGSCRASRVISVTRAWGVPRIGPTRHPIGGPPGNQNLVGGVRFDWLDHAGVCRTIEQWRQEGSHRYVCITNPHSVMMCRRESTDAGGD